MRAKVGGVFAPTLREDAVGTLLPAGTEMGKILDLHTLAELQVSRADGHDAHASPDLHHRGLGARVRRGQAGLTGPPLAALVTAPWSRPRRISTTRH
jgi:hypothetical protein